MLQRAASSAGVISILSRRGQKRANSTASGRVLGEGSDFRHGSECEKVARRLLSTEEAGEYLDTTERHVRRLVSDHQLSRYKVGGRNWFADVDLDAWLDARRVAGAMRSGSSSTDMQR